MRFFIPFNLDVLATLNVTIRAAAGSLLIILVSDMFLCYCYDDGQPCGANCAPV